MLIMLGTFFTLMYFVTGRTGPSEHYFVRYKNVSGLKFGTGVFYEGYRVGQIEKIIPVPSSTGMEYVITLSVARNWEIPEDSVANIMSSGLVSAVRIEITEGRSSVNMVPGGELEGREQLNLLSVLGDVAGELGTLSEDGVMPVLKNLNVRIDEASQRINKDLVGDAQALIVKLDSSAQQLEKLLVSVNPQKVEKFLTRIDDVALNVNVLISRIEGTRVQMGETLLALKNLASDNDEEVASAIRSANDSMQQALETLTVVNEHVATIMYNVEGSTRQLHEFSRAVRNNPSRLVRGSGPRDEAD
ncbi:MAG TPA: hypothetical protein DGR97_02525 [Gammaproteobacteria bacterium]|nr:hypothetical protein [Gammaproteobacteria bacterium]